MKRITITMPMGHIMHGSLYSSQFFKFISVEDDSLFIFFLHKTNWFIPKLIKSVKAEKYYLPNFDFWSLRLSLY